MSTMHGLTIQIVKVTGVILKKLMPGINGKTKMKAATGKMV